MNKILQNAILAMDSYNRGYGASLVFGNNPGTNNYSIDTPNIQIGTAVIYDSAGDAAAQGIGFYALAYEIKDNSGAVIDTVISYRGTDGIVKDAAFGYGPFFGNPSGPQGRQTKMAFDFYNEVAVQANGGAPIDPQQADITLTGHSLGGGLAGFIGANDNNQLWSVAA